MPRCFAATSFWNQPIDPKAKTDPRSADYLQCMRDRDPRGLWLNLHKWTIPIYRVDSTTPRRKVHRRLSLDKPEHWVLRRSAAHLYPGHPLGFHEAFSRDAEQGLVPIPDYAVADPASDAHFAVVDFDSGWAWDMWQAARLPNGEFESNTGMKYRIDGSGVFGRDEFDVHNGESIHAYGPGRAAGVPIVAGTILHEEIRAGRIEHKLAFATQAAALQQFVSPPACWTDGGWRNGLPEGATIQLSPDLDVTGLPSAARVVARALQEYGAVCVDVAGGHCLYGEGLYADPSHRSWDGLLAGDDLQKIGLEHYRVLQIDQLISEGMGPRVPDGIYAGVDEPVA